MNPRRHVVALSASALVSASLLVAAGCGDYSQPKDPATGGVSGVSGTPSMGGTGGTAQGGSGGAAGSEQSGGAMAGGGQSGGAAGSGQSGSGGMSGGMGGSGGGQASCDEVAACGGDLTGTWTIASCPLALTGAVDVTGLGLIVECMAPITTGSLQLTGSMAFNGVDMTLTDMSTMSGEVTFELGANCLEISGTETTCEEIGGPLRSIGFSMLTCMDNTTTMGCTCVGIIQQENGFGFKSYDAGPSGTYTTMTANEVALKWFGDPVDYAYCVAGNTLTMTMESVPKTGTVDGPIVLQKQ